MGKLVLVLIKRVVDVKNCASRITEDGIYALLEQYVNKYFRTV